MKIKNVCVIGLGYVGLTLSVVLAEAGFNVYGVEINKATVKQLKKAKPHFHEKGLDYLLRKRLEKNLFLSEKIPDEQMDVFIISVGTPIDEDKKPILDYIINSTEQVAEKIKDNALIILRSTLPVGATRKIVKPILDKSGKKYFLSFCPERTIEGKALTELKELPQIVGGLDEKSVELSIDMFRKITPTIVEVESLEAAEMIKILNNTYRDLNFAFANEFALICENLGLNASKLIDAANLGYTRSNMPKPGFVGGACLEKDPHILIDFSEKAGYYPHLVEHSRKINENLPLYVVNRVDKKLQELKVDKNAKILISGFAFKGRPETDDLRGSLTLNLLNHLKELGYKNIHGHDFVVSKKELEKLDVTPCSIEDGFKEASCVIIANNHQSYSSLDIENLISSMKKPCLFMDCWSTFDSKLIKRENVAYGGIGID